ncbi:MAG: hypothetical protein EOP90_00340 [Lysobacteraceae bacterium]|nr:MAG: hypothetical protein EOP90_00340 [Xanthomonadaceae bacterium]
MSTRMIRTVLSVSIAATLCAGAQAASPMHWVRAETNATQLRQVLGADIAAADYGRYQWLGTDAPGLERLRAAGIAVAEADAPFVLDLGGMRFDPLEGEPRVAGWEMRAEADAADLRLVQFDGPVREQDLESLRAAGLEPLQYIHPFTYVAWGARDALSRASTHAGVRWSGDFAPAYRVLPRWRALDQSVIAVNVLVYRDAVGVEAALAAAGAEVGARHPIDRGFAVVGVRAAGNLFDAIARIPGVYSVQPVPTDGGLRGEMSNQVNAGNIDAGNLAVPGYLAWLDGIGLRGTGVILADVDGGIHDTHPDLVNRMLPCTGPTCGGSATDAHGTHTAGIMAADGSSGVLAGGFLRGLGMAPGANLIEQVYWPTFTQPGGMLTLMTDSARNAAYASGNSWGPAGSPLGYDGDTRQVDVGVRDADPEAAGDQPLLYVLSAMNGNGGTSSLGTPDEGKNMFTIGSTKMQSASTVQYTDIDNISSNSSHGPALDGRSVPAMVAPGCSVDSSASATGYQLMCGTSMASPHVTGASALFVEYYRTLAGTDPSPALVKAAFTAVAKDLTGNRDADGNLLTHLFDNKQGWGRMQVAPVVAPAQAVQYIDQSVVFDATGESWTMTFVADDPAQPIRIMLAWTDAPGHGLGGSTPAWNNNLDLRVTADGDAYAGNVLDASGWSTTGGVADAKNNTEAVFLQPAQHSGSVTVEVLATDINSDGLPASGDATDQDFALVCYNCVGEAAAGADLSVSAEAEAATFLPGQALVFGVTVSNAGPDDADGVSVTLSAPDLEDISASLFSDWQCAPQPGGAICTYPSTLAAGDASLLVVESTVAASAIGPVVASFGVSAAQADGNASNNASVVEIALLDLIFADGFEAPSP